MTNCLWVKKTAHFISWCLCNKKPLLQNWWRKYTYPTIPLCERANNTSYRLLCKEQTKEKNWHQCLVSMKLRKLLLHLPEIHSNRWRLLEHRETDTKDVDNVDDKRLHQRVLSTSEKSSFYPQKIFLTIEVKHATNELNTKTIKFNSILFKENFAFRELTSAAFLSSG